MDSFTKKARILIVDDNAANVKFLERLLDMSGFENLRAETDSRVVPDIIIQEVPHLVLLDLEMPYLDGFQVLEKIREAGLNNRVSVLVLTANQETEYRHRALDGGAQDYLSKPLDRREVVLRITNLLEANLHRRMLEEEREQLNHLVQLKTRELRDTQLEIVRRLGKAAEYKDNETGNHILRMSKFSALIARELGWSAEQCELILHASPMHDVGKIGIPDSILLKPGRLDPEERKIMNTHAEMGAQIIGEHESDLLRMARVIALSHHEKWDGSGYPRGLAGQDIPMEGRIVALADVFDALTSERPYKKAWPREEAVSFLKENSGSHFDPHLVDIFLRCLPEIEAIQAEHGDG